MNSGCVPAKEFDESFATKLDSQMSVFMEICRNLSGFDAVMDAAGCRPRHRKGHSSNSNEAAELTMVVWQNRSGKGALRLQLSNLASRVNFY